MINKLDTETIKCKKFTRFFNFTILLYIQNYNLKKKLLTF